LRVWRNRGAGRRSSWTLCRWWSCLYASCWPHVPNEKPPPAAPLTTALAPPMHSLASSLPPIPPRRVPAPRCTITRSRPPTPLNPPTVTLAPEPWIRGAFFHTPQDHPNSPIREERLSRKPQIGARILMNRVQRRRWGFDWKIWGFRGRVRDGNSAWGLVSI
jgi:hypothetical protein